MNHEETILYSIQTSKFSQNLVFVVLLQRTSTQAKNVLKKVQHLPSQKEKGVDSTAVSIFVFALLVKWIKWTNAVSFCQFNQYDYNY